MLTEVGKLRAVLAGMAVLVAVRSVNAYMMPTTATDLTWVYRIGLPVSAAVIAYGAVRGQIIGTSKLFAPLAVIATIRVVDFVQDWFVTPAVVEPVSLGTRLGPGIFGWGMAVGFALIVHLFERLIVARWSPPDPGHLCLNAPGCPSFMDASQQ